MQVDLSPATAEALKRRAAQQGLSVSSYLEALLREPGLWAEQDPSGLPDPADGELAETRAAIAEGLRDADAGRLTHADEVFAEIRRRHGISR